MHKASQSLTPDETTSIILESISDGVFTVDYDWRVQSFNRAAEVITGISRDEAIGRRCCEVFRASMCETDCALRRTMESGRPVIDQAAYIVNPEGKRIPISLSTALLRDHTGQVIGGVETFRDLSLVEELRKAIAQRYEAGDIISVSASMRTLLEVLPQIAASESSVVIQGETGVGKELLARALHDLSGRRKGPFIAVNCGALPDALLESELFGYRAGAFTGAVKDKPGRFALAEGGTLFLDEIGDVSPAMQVRLLRVLQERCFEPLGGAATVPANVRVIAASNKDLAQLVSAGLFRQDLYYRLNVVRLTLPPLRERKEDIPLLVERFIQKMNRLRNRSIHGVTRSAMGLLMAYDYPGNIRELENGIEYAFAICPGNEIGPSCLPESISPRRLKESANPIEGGGRSRLNRLALAEASAIQEVLRQCGGDRSKAASALGMHRSTLYRHMRALGIVHAP